MWDRPKENYLPELRNIVLIYVNKTSGSLSIVSLHRLEGHDFNWDNVSILDEEPNYKKKLIADM